MQSNRKPYRTAADATEAKLALWRPAMVAGFVSESLRTWQTKEDYAVPTVENVTVEASPDSTWQSMGVLFAIDGVPASSCILSRALEYALIGMSAQLTQLQSELDAVQNVPEQIGQHVEQAYNALFGDQAGTGLSYQEEAEILAQYIASLPSETKHLPHR